MTIDPGSGLSASTLTTADGRALRYVHAGEGGPVVVFEAGMGACAGEWVRVQRLVAATTGTVSYDRAGYGGSTRDTRPRSLARICEDLHALVEHVSPDRAVVLVAHSWGGPIVRCYAEQHPGRVAGVVMVDATSTAVLTDKRASSMPYSMAVAHRLNGVLRPFIRRAVGRQVSPDTSAEDRGILVRDLTSKQDLGVAVAESRAAASSVPLMARWERDGLPRVPVINLVGAGTGSQAKIRARLISGAQTEMSLHPLGECRVVDGTDHFVPQHKPHETVRAVLDVVERARAAVEPA